MASLYVRGVSFSCCLGDLASAFRLHRRPRTANFDLRRAAEIEMDDLPAACNSSSRRSSSGVQILYLFPTMLRKTGKGSNRSCPTKPGRSLAVGADQLELFGSQWPGRQLRRA